MINDSALPLEDQGELEWCHRDVDKCTRCGEIWFFELVFVDGCPSCRA